MGKELIWHHMSEVPENTKQKFWFITGRAKGSKIRCIPWNEARYGRETYHAWAIPVTPDFDD